MKRLLALPLLLVSLALAAAPVIELKTPSQGDFSSAVATLTNKTISGPNNVILNPAQSGGFSAPQLNHWRAALARMRAGTGRARVLLIGDSTTDGAGAGTSGTTNLVGSEAKNRGNSLATILKALGIPSSYNSFVSDGNVTLNSVTLQQYDPRVSAFGTGWATFSPQKIPGGILIAFSGATPGTFTFTPTGAVDTAVIYFVRQTTSGSFAVNVDGGSTISTPTTSGTANSVGSATITFTKGTHAINLVATGNGNINLMGIVTYDSTTPAVDIVNAGWYGATLTNWIDNTAAYSPLNVASDYQPNLTIIQLTINDSNGGATPANYSANLQTLVTACLTTGDVVIESGIPSNTTQATNGQLASIVAAARAVAASNNLPFWDINARWTSYAVTNPIMPYFDSDHATAVGYADIAQMEAILLNQ